MHCVHTITSVLSLNSGLIVVYVVFDDLRYRSHKSGYCCQNSYQYLCIHLFPPLIVLVFTSCVWVYQLTLTVISGIPFTSFLQNQLCFSAEYAVDYYHHITHLPFRTCCLNPHAFHKELLRR